MAENPNRALIDGLREFADFLEQYPDAGRVWSCGNVFNVFGDLQGVARSGYGKLEKDTCGHFFTLRKRFGPISLEWNQAREDVCTKVVETRKVMKPVMRQVGMEEVEEEVVTWKCPDSLLKEAS